jgi:molybdopterin biosynthesis enzyme
MRPGKPPALHGEKILPGAPAASLEYFQTILKEALTKL